MLNSAFKISDKDMGFDTVFYLKSNLADDMELSSIVFLPEALKASKNEEEINDKVTIVNKYKHLFNIWGRY